MNPKAGASLPLEDFEQVSDYVLLLYHKHLICLVVTFSVTFLTFKMYARLLSYINF